MLNVSGAITNAIMTDKYMGSLDKTIYNNMDIELDEKK